MSFSSTVEMTGNAACIILKGDFGEEGAHHFQADADWAAEHHAGRIVIQLDGVYRVSDEGVDALKQVRQRLAHEAEIFLVGAIDSVERLLRNAGLHEGFTFADEHPCR